VEQVLRQEMRDAADRTGPLPRDNQQFGRSRTPENIPDQIQDQAARPNDSRPNRITAVMVSAPSISHYKFRFKNRQM
jgi:hypothetical protein